MAEERLIDDDKDRRYKIRKNADGEDELYIDDTPEEEEPEEAIFEAPDWTEEGEEDVLTPEQKAERERLQREADEARKRRVSALLERAALLMDSGDWEGALLKCEEAEEVSPDGDIYPLKAEILTRRFTEFGREELEETAKGLKERSNAEQKEKLAYGVPVLEERVKSLSGEVEKLGGENEAKKAERRRIFCENRKKALIFLACAAVPTIVFIVLAAVFGNAIHAVKDSYANLALTIVFAALAAVGFVCALIALNKFWTAQRNVKLNEKNSSTQLGRTLEEKKAELEVSKLLLEAIATPAEEQ